jgi:hypothetical protein
VLVALSMAQFMVILAVTAGTVALVSISRALLAVPPVRPAPGVNAAVH